MIDAALGADCEISEIRQIEIGIRFYELMSRRRGEGRGILPHGGESNRALTRRSTRALQMTFEFRDFPNSFVD